MLFALCYIAGLLPAAVILDVCEAHARDTWRAATWRVMIYPLWFTVMVATAAAVIASMAARRAASAVQWLCSRTIAACARIAAPIFA